MRPHLFKGVPTDRFIGTSTDLYKSESKKNDKAFKEIQELGWNYSWAVLWCPVIELPEEYLRNAHKNPYISDTDSMADNL